jgi:NitT/TauT family transport system ATP-binding protein
MTNVIEATNVKKLYPPDILAIDGFDFQMKEGEFVSLIGPTGCGKTTFLRIVAGFEDIQQGQVLFKGKPVEAPDPKRGVIFQDIRLFPWMTVKENILFGCKSRGAKGEEQKKSLKETMELMQLDNEALNMYPDRLSTGMRQRVGVARVLANSPDIMLLDEPLNSLDWLTRDYIQTTILKLWHETKKPTLFVTHNIPEAVFVAQRVVVMTARPGKEKAIVNVDLPERRWELRRNDQHYLDLVKTTSRLVEDELSKAREVEKVVGY